MAEKDRPNYYAIIPASVRYDNKLKPNEKLLYAEITALSNKEGKCWASNSYFAELYGVSAETVSRWISGLVSNNHLKREIIYEEDGKTIEKRFLFPVFDNPIDKIINTPIDEKVNTPIDEIVKDNTTRVNTTRVNNYSSTIKELSSVFSQSIKDYATLHDAYWGVIKATRKTNDVAESIIARSMEYWSEYDPKVVEYALKLHVAKYKDKRENYTLGIIRNTKVEEIKSIAEDDRKVVEF